MDPRSAPGTTAVPFALSSISDAPSAVQLFCHGVCRLPGTFHLSVIVQSPVVGLKNFMDLYLTR